MYYFVFVNLDTEMDLMNETIEDFTLMISNIPVAISYSDLVKAISYDSDKIQEIMPIYKQHEYQELKEEQEELINKIVHLLMEKKEKYRGLNLEMLTLDKLYDKLRQLNMKTEAYENIVSSSIFNKDTFAGRAIVIFKTEKDSAEFFKKWNVGSFDRFMRYFFNPRGKMLNDFHIAGMCEPDDIIWKNLEFEYGEKICRTFVVYLVSSILILISFHILYVLTVKQNEYRDNSIKTQLMSLAYTIVTNGIEFVIGEVLLYMSR